MKVVDEPEDPLDARVHDQGVKAVHDEDARSSLVEERRRRGPEVLQPAWVRRADSVVERRDAKEVSTIDPGRTPPGSDPEEGSVQLGEEADEGGRDGFPLEREIALAALQRRSDDAPP